jgi:hypothetical protein
VPDDPEETMLDRHDCFAAWHHRWNNARRSPLIPVPLPDWPVPPPKEERGG